MSVIEEVGEDIGRGVRRRTTSTIGPGKGAPSPGGGGGSLSGVCRERRPVLLRV